MLKSVPKIFVFLFISILADEHDHVLPVYPGQQPGQGGYPGQQPGQGGYPGQQPPPAQVGVPGQQSYALQGQRGYDQAPGGVPSATAGMDNFQIGGVSMGDIPRPTIRPANPFNCELDTMTLRTAMRGIGTDEKAIIQVIGHTSNKQRQEILDMYKSVYGKDLISDLKSKLSSDLEELILALVKSPEYYDAWCLNKAMRGMGTIESILIEILTTRTNAEIRGIKAAYKQHFERELEADCASETSGHFKRLLVSFFQANRTELTDSQRQMLMQRGPEAVVDRALAQQDAQTLYKEGVKKFGTDESAFLSVLSIRHEYQMRATFEEYQKLSGKDILSSIGSEMSLDLEYGFKAIIMSAMNRPKFFSDKLYEAMRGMGTDDSTLIRIIVSRSEIDLQNIKDQYQRDHGKSLNAAVSSETSGDYKKLLLAIVGQ